MNERSLRVDGLKVRCLEQGKGPAVLLLHGASLGSSADVWARNLVPLAAHGLRVIAPDLPGFGHTDNPADHSLTYRQRFVRMLMDALELERAALVGHSQAGRIAVQLAFTAPERVTRAVVVATGSLLPLLEGAASEGDEGTAAEPTLAETRTLLEGNLYHKSLATDEAVALRHRMSVGKNFQAFLARKQAKGVAKSGEPLWQRLAQCPVPLLMLYGDHDRGDAARRVARAKELYPQLEVRLLPDAAHLAQWDAADAFAEIAGRFLGAR
ncbi:MAG TPA: alpha/beta hydrolase [Burkholderiales bacterium]|nr:alpha/beta hydrolase [Burkholderiales bacterium]